MQRLRWQEDTENLSQKHEPKLEYLAPKHGTLGPTFSLRKGPELLRGHVVGMVELEPGAPFEPSPN